MSAGEDDRKKPSILFECCVIPYELWIHSLLVIATIAAAFFGWLYPPTTTPGWKGVLSLIFGGVAVLCTGLLWRISFWNRKVEEYRKQDDAQSRSELEKSLLDQDDIRDLKLLSLLLAAFWKLLDEETVGDDPQTRKDEFRLTYHRLVPSKDGSGDDELEQAIGYVGAPNRGFGAGRTFRVDRGVVGYALTRRDGVVWRRAQGQTYDEALQQLGYTSKSSRQSLTRGREEFAAFPVYSLTEPLLCYGVLYFDCGRSGFLGEEGSSRWSLLETLCFLLSRYEDDS